MEFIAETDRVGLDFSRLNPVVVEIKLGIVYWRI